MTALDATQLLANAATALGVPLALVLFWNEKRRERREREYGTYNALDEKYLEYLQLCIQHPRLDMYYLPLDAPPSLSEEERIQQAAMFEVLVSLLERAFLMYRDQSDAIKKAQWLGWNAYMQSWCAHRTFRLLWSLHGEQWDRDFMAHLGRMVDESAEAGAA